MMTELPVPVKWYFNEISIHLNEVCDVPMYYCTNCNGYIFNFNSLEFLPSINVCEEDIPDYSSNNFDDVILQLKVYLRREADNKLYE